MTQRRPDLREMAGHSALEAMSMADQSKALAQSNPVEVLQAEFDRKRDDVEAMMREHGDSTPRTDRIFAVALTKYRAILNGLKPSDRVIDPFSVVDCVLQAAQLGLEAGSDQAYLVPYNGRVSLIVSPRGLIDLAFRHPQVRDVNAAVVRAGDYFEYELGDEPRIRHRKGESDALGALTHVYAVMTLASGGKIRAVLTAAEVAFYRRFSKAPTGPWIDNTAAMWEKTALKRMMAKGPRSPQMAAAMVENDQGHYVPPGEDERTALASRTVDLQPRTSGPAAPMTHVHLDGDAAFASAPPGALLGLLTAAREEDHGTAAEQAFAGRVAVLLGSVDAAGYDDLRVVANEAALIGPTPRATIRRALAVADERLGTR